MTQSTNYKLRVFLALALCLAAVPTTRAERLALSPTDIWETWTYPAGAVQLEERGPLRPILIAQNINSLANATVRGAGAASASALRAFDGVNDALQISVDVLKVIDARPIAARVYDLHGRLVRTLNDAAGVAGHDQLSRDGRRNSRALATPGLYFFHLQISGDSSTRTLIRSIGLSY